MNELFNIADVTHESPRLAWLKRHGVKTHHHDDGSWRATGKRKTLGDDEVWHNDAGRGATEHDAIADLADLLGIPLWNEEEFAATPAQKRESKNT